MDGADTDVKKGAMDGTRSIDSIPGVLTSQQKYTGQEHRVAKTKGRKPEGAAIRDKPKSKEKDVQTKDVEEAIKTCDVIVEKWKR